jgi:hypothetical protein
MSERLPGDEFTSTSGGVSFYPDTQTGEQYVTPMEVTYRGGRETRISPTSRIDRAVYSYLGAIRALGRTRVSAEEIASRLGIPQEQAEASLKRLQTKGVRILTR